jgi:hypothetical protein
LADLAEENAQGSVQDPEIGGKVALGMKDIGGLPEFSPVRASGPESE